MSGPVFDGVFKMHRRCPICRLEYEREQGYFIGAMYISYGMAMALSVMVFLVVVQFLGSSMVVFVITLVLLLALLSPFLVRYSRILWMHFDQFLDPR